MTRIVTAHYRYKRPLRRKAKGRGDQRAGDPRSRTQPIRCSGGPVSPGRGVKL